MSDRFKFFSEDSQKKENNPVIQANGGELKLKAIKGQRYQIDYQSIMIALGNKVIDLKSESIWLISELQVVDDGYVVYLEIEKHEVFNSNELLNGMIDFSKLLNIPMEKLVIRLDAFGNIRQVLNTGEVFNKWVEIKQQLLPFLNEEEAAIIIRNGDIQFKQPISMLQTGLIYNLFFMPVYGLKQKGKTENIATGNFQSQLFQDKVIPYIVNEKVESLTETEIDLLFDTDSSAFDKRELEAIYNSVYREAMAEEFNYEILFSGRGTYDLITGLTKSCFIQTKEKANPDLYFEGSYLIKKI